MGTEVRKPPYTCTASDVRALAIGLGLCLPLIGCSPPNVVTPAANESPTPRSSAVSAATWADGPWPFTIERGELNCIGPANDPSVFIVTDTGETFALNPAAIHMAHEVGAMADLDPIWREHPDIARCKGECVARDRVRTDALLNDGRIDLTATSRFAPGLGRKAVSPRPGHPEHVGPANRGGPVRVRLAELPVRPGAGHAQRQAAAPARVVAIPAQPHRVLDILHAPPARLQSDLPVGLGRGPSAAEVGCRQAHGVERTNELDGKRSADVGENRVRDTDHVAAKLRATLACRLLRPAPRAARSAKRSGIGPTFPRRTHFPSGPRSRDLPLIGGARYALRNRHPVCQAFFLSLPPTRNSTHSWPGTNPVVSDRKCSPENDRA